MPVNIQQIGTSWAAAIAMLQASQPQEGLLQHVADFLLGSIPTALIFIVLVVAYQFLVQRPLSAALRQRRALTEGALEEAQKAIDRAEQRAAEHAAKLREARAEIYRMREQRIKQWNAERDAALEAARAAAHQKVSRAKAEIEAEAASARQAIQASAADLAGQAIRAVLPLAAGGSH
jgi:F-type H+-transporting ATPase subunit b